MHFFSVSDRRYCFDEVTRNCFQVDQASEDALRIFEASGRTVNSKLLTKSLAAKGYDQTTIAELEDDIDEYQRLSERTFLTKDTPRKLRSSNSTFHMHATLVVVTVLPVKEIMERLLC